MSPDFYRCLQYEDLDTLSESRKDLLANFLHPQVIPYVLDVMIEKLHYNRSKPSFPSNGHTPTMPGKSCCKKLIL